MTDDLPDLIAEAVDVLRSSARAGHKLHVALGKDSTPASELAELSADIARRIELADRLSAHIDRLRHKPTQLEAAMAKLPDFKPGNPA